MSLPSDLLTVEEAARRFGKCTSRIHQLVSQRRIRRYSDHYFLRVSEAEIAWWYGLSGQERLSLIEKTRYRNYTAIEAAAEAQGIDDPDEWSAVKAGELPSAVPLPDDLISLPEAAKLVARNSATIRRWIRYGLLVRYDGAQREPNSSARYMLVSRAEVLHVSGMRKSPTTESPEPVPDAPAALSFFRRLHEAREAIEWNLDTESVAMTALQGFDAGVRACLPSVAPALVSPEAYGYFAGYNGWALEPDRPGRSVEWMKAAKMAWADGLWDQKGNRLYADPAGKAV